jgi:hypothetical protein
VSSWSTLAKTDHSNAASRRKHMPSSTYEIRIRIKDVAVGDVEDVAQHIYDAHGEELDAAKGDFEITISKDGFGVDWEPNV